MQQVEEHISRINHKLQELLKKYAILVKEKELQQRTIQKLAQENENREARIKMLEEQQHILKAAAGKMSDPDKKEFEQALNRYIREIDKCIHLLNE